MRKLFVNLEIKKFNKLASDEDAVLFTAGNELQKIYNKRTKKYYYPKALMLVSR